MKSTLKMFLVSLLAFGTISSFNQFAYSDVNKSFNLAIVDVQKLVQNYDKVNELKKDQQAKLQELKSFIEDARAQVSKEKDANKKKALEDKYNKELNDKKNIIDTNYAQQLQGINQDINAAINKTAKDKQIDLVLTKSSVLYGGNDLTNDVLSNLKK